MRTELLKYIIEIDKYHSISKASSNLYISQAALSESISQFEKDLNVTIFKRSKKGVTTTEAGMQIIEQAKVILKELEKLQHISIYAPAKINYSEKLSFGVTEKFADVTLNETINLALKKYPDLTFNVVNLNSQLSIQQVAAQELDFAFVAINNKGKDVMLDAFRDMALKHIPLSTDQVCVLANKQSPLAQKEFLTLKDTASATLISYSGFGDSETYEQKTILLSSFDSILQMISDNMGISILPYSLLQQNKDKIGDNLMVRTLTDASQLNCVVYSTKKALTPAQEFFIKLYAHIYQENYLLTKEE